MVQFCPKCGTKAPDDEAVFCNKCGNKLPVIIPEKKDVACPKCGTKVLDSNSVFCDKCGFQLRAISPGSVQQVDERPIVTQPTIKKKRCPACGAPIDNENRYYCQSCGAYLKGSQSTVTPQPAQPSYYLPPASHATQIPIPQQNASIANSGTQKRSAGEWVVICCGGIILLIVVSAFLSGLSAGIKSSTSKDEIITQDLSSMALTINDMPTGWTVAEPAVVKNGNFSVQFMRLAGFTGYFVYLDIFKYPTVESARAAYQSDKAKITQYKVESVSLGNEGYGYVDDQASNVVFRRGNIIVKTLYSESGITGFSNYLSISDSKKYAEIVADRIK